MDSVEKATVDHVGKQWLRYEGPSAYRPWIESVLAGGDALVPDAGILRLPGGESFLFAVHYIASARHAPDPEIRREHLLDSMLSSIMADNMAAFAATNPDTWNRYAAAQNVPYERERNADPDDDLLFGASDELMRGWYDTPEVREAEITSWKNVLESLRRVRRLAHLSEE